MPGCCREKTKIKARRVVALARTAVRLEARAAQIVKRNPGLARELRTEAARADREALALMGEEDDEGPTAADWSGNPKGWDSSSRRKFWESIGGSGEHKRTRCMEKIKGHVDNPGAFCQSLYSEFEV